MRDPLLVRGSFFRRNLRLHAVKKGEGPARARRHRPARPRAPRRERDRLRALAPARSRTPRTTCAGHGVRAAAYHAGLDAETRDARAGRLPGGRDRRRRRDGRLRHGDRQAGHPLRRPPRPAALGRGLLPGDRPRRARRAARPTASLFYSWADVLAWERLSQDSDGAVAAAQKRQARAMFRLAGGGGLPARAARRPLRRVDPAVRGRLRLLHRRGAALGGQPRAPRGAGGRAAAPPRRRRRPRRRRYRYTS